MDRRPLAYAKPQVLFVGYLGPLSACFPRTQGGLSFWYTRKAQPFRLGVERIPLKMKPGIHPAYNELNVICACGHTFKTRSTHKGDIRVEICSHCHPFFTGKQKLMDTAGRIDRFEKKYKDTRGVKKAQAQPVA